MASQLIENLVENTLNASLNAYSKRASSEVPHMSSRKKQKTEEQPLAVEVKHDHKEGKVWLFLVNGAVASFDAESVARDELKKIYNCFVSNKLVKPEHVVCASGGKKKLFQHKTKMEISSLSSVTNPSTPMTDIAASKGRTNSQGCQRYVGGNGKCVAPGHEHHDDLSVEDSAVFIYIGDGRVPQHPFQMPPSDNEDTGRLIINSDQLINNRSFYRGDDLNCFHVNAGKTLFICQSCYSGNIIGKVLKGNTQMLAIATDPDHPAISEPILSDAITDFFSESEWMNKSLSEFHDYIQKKYYDSPNCKKAFRDCIKQTEQEYEEERLETIDWAADKQFTMYPRKIPEDLWSLFREVENHNSSISYADRNREQQLAHVSKMEQHRFSLMRMYKHKPNYKLNMYGSVDVLGKNTMAEFLQLSGH